MAGLHDAAGSQAGPFSLPDQLHGGVEVEGRRLDCLPTDLAIDHLATGTSNITAKFNRYTSTEASPPAAKVPSWTGARPFAKCCATCGCTTSRTQVYGMGSTAGSWHVWPGNTAGDGPSCSIFRPDPKRLPADGGGVPRQPGRSPRPLVSELSKLRGALQASAGGRPASAAARSKRLCRRGPDFPRLRPSANRRVSTEEIRWSDKPWRLKRPTRP